MPCNPDRVQEDIQAHSKEQKGDEQTSGRRLRRLLSRLIGFLGGRIRGNLVHDEGDYKRKRNAYADNK